jgi:ATP-dependent Clp protease protease subunit
MGKSKVKENIDYLVSYGIDLENRKLHLVGEVDDKMFRRALVGLTALSQINTEPITIILNSEGGDLYQGLAIYDLISSCDAQVNIHVIGIAMSAAVIILQAGEVRTCTPNSEFMIHDGSVGLNTEEPETAMIQMDHDKKLRKKMKDVIVGRTGIKWSARDRYFNAEEANMHGLVDEVKL